MKCYCFSPKAIVKFVAALVAAYVLSVSVSVGDDSGGVAAPDSSYKEGELIIQLAPGATGASLMNDFASYNLQPKK